VRFYALACDYDGTLATDGHVGQPALDALRRLRESGRKLVLVTGRLLPDLAALFEPLDLFDRVIAENGAVLYRPAGKEELPLAEPLPAEFVSTLAERGVAPLQLGRVIAATMRPHETTVLSTIRDLGLELQVIFNREAVMVLPSGVNKGTGLQAALEELGLTFHNVVGIGDAENDHGFLDLCECAVAVANALPAVRQRATFVTESENGGGVAELAARMLEDDLAGFARRAIVLGHAPDGAPVTMAGHGENILVAGPSGSGKSTFASAFLEQLRAQGYQFCILDPEGDFQATASITTIGDAERAPTVREVIQLLEPPAQSVAVNLLGVGLPDRPSFFAQVLTAILELRARTGRPHWLIIDEAHHVLPRERSDAELTVPHGMKGVLMITVHPEHVSPETLASADVVVAIGKAPHVTLGSFAAARQIPAPPVPPDDLPTGEGLAWRPARDDRPVRFVGVMPREERRRHRRKYAEGELPPDRSFYFRGPKGTLNLRAQNLKLFLQIADGVDQATWRHHFENGDVTRWLGEAIKDPELAEQVAALTAQGLPADEARRQVRALIEARYTEAP
jgi:hydroxymethylpyrimidine pyrophosphatase-like HAD family hydrolase/GTPase SAR1 family protein